MIGTTISHYKILEKLGEGGMGVVYKAQDTKLNRTVALKFLPDRVNQDSAAKERFLQEAQAAAALNHPNICTIHGVDEHDGHLYMVLEYIEGGTLRAKLPFPKTDDAIKVAIQIGEALQEAHTKGIVHRDIKSDNIMLTAKGQAKVMDFGLAKLKGSLKLTKTSSTVGTLGYMAPEQIQGGEVDHRSDIFSFGVLLFEMLTGKLPFRGEHEAAMLYSIVNEDPQDIHQLIHDLSPLIANLIQRCLEKNPDERYQHFDDIVADLKRSQKKTTKVSRSTAYRPVAPATESRTKGKFKPILVAVVVVLVVGGVYLLIPKSETAQTTETHGKTIAVLPFTNMSGDLQDEYFSDGMTEDILTQLAKIADLKVISRTSVMQYKGTKKTIREIGKELNAGVVLEGSVRRASNTVRITAELINATTDEHLWAETYDKELKDIFSIQSDVAQKIAGALKASLSTAEKKRIEKAPTKNMDAYNLYLKGDFFIRKATGEDLLKGLAFMNEATKLDSNFALPYSGIAFYNAMATDFYLAPVVAMPDVRKATTRALEIDNDQSQAHSWLGFYHYWYDWNWNAARLELLKAIDLGPQDWTAHFNYGWYLLSQGNLIDALAEEKKYLELEPITPDANAIYAMCFYYQRDYDAMFSQLQKTLDLNQNYPFAHLFLGWYYISQRQFSEAIAEHKKSHELFAAPWSLARLGYAYARAGQTNEARAILDSLSRQSKTVYVPSDVVASIYVALGNKERAFEYLQKGYEERAGWMTFIKVDPIWDPLRTDPRFTQLLRKMGLEK